MAHRIQTRPIDGQLELPVSPYHPAVQDTLDRINGVERRSELRALAGVTLSRLRLAHGLSVEDVDVIADRLNARRAELTAPDEAFRSPDIAEEAVGEWSATALQASLPETRELDWRERQLPIGDR